MPAKSLKDLYKSVDERAKVIYVVPLIRMTHKKTDYLYLLYQDLFKDDEFKIQTISVYNHFKMLSGILRNRNAILHYHWLEFQDLKSLLGMPWKLFCIRLFLLFGGKIIWTVHNEFPHDQKYLSLHSFLHRRMAKWAAKIHVHCNCAVHIMKNRLKAPADKFFVFPHPSYPAEIGTKNEAVSMLNKEYEIALEPDIPVLLMFGNISRYKQMEKVAELIREQAKDCRLLIVGPVKKGNMNLFKQLKQLEKQSSRIILIPKFIPEEHVPWFHNAADICVFNYREILSSGGIHMALSYQKKIIAPDKGCLVELKDHPDVTLFENEEELTIQLSNFLNNQK